MADPFLLLVESNPDDIFLTMRELHKHSYPLPIRVIADGADALAYLDAARQYPALVLLDYRLARVSGDEVLAALKGHAQMERVPVVVMFGSQEECDRLGAALADRGASACLVKPLQYRELQAVLGPDRLVPLRPGPVD